MQVQGCSVISKVLKPGEVKVSGSGALERLGFLRRSMIMSRLDALSSCQLQNLTIRSAHLPCFSEMAFILSTKSSSKTEPSIDFLPKKIGAKIGMRHTTILLLSDQVVDATQGLGRDSKGRISSGKFSNFSMRIIKPTLLASTQEKLGLFFHLGYYCQRSRRLFHFHQ